MDGSDTDTSAATREIEASPAAWAKACGVCHVGGGQMEYDRDMLPYGQAGATNEGDRYTWMPAHIAPAGGETLIGLDGTPATYAEGSLVLGRIVDISANTDVQGTQLFGANNAEVDCMMCHANQLKTGAAWYRSEDCGPAKQIGPADNRDCSTSDPRFQYTAGTIYDSFNRNIAISEGWFDLAASAGIGVKIDKATGTLAEDTPTTIPGSSISAVPNSGNCAQCHARNDADNIGLPGEAQQYGGMITGYGNFFKFTGPEEAVDLDEIDSSGNCAAGKDCKNDTTWGEFGCKTGMGKRSQKTGYGSNDRFGFGVCLGCAAFSAMNGGPNMWWLGMDGMEFTADDGVCGMPSIREACNAGAGGVNLQTNPEYIWEAPGVPKQIAGKMADVDVHDAAGMKCATCHYAVSGTLPARTYTANGQTYTYPATDPANPIQKIDHQIAQGFSMLEHANDQLDGTVTCEGCHIDKTHPNAGSAPDPATAHAAFPPAHFEKIDCRTCHIPAVYSAPGRLGFRDWTAGGYRQSDGSNGNANHFDFNYNFMDGGAGSMPPLRAWLANPEGTKITPMLPSLLPIWTGSGIRASDNFVLGWMPAKTRDITSAAAIVSAANPGFGIRLNGTNDHPPFQGFQLTDPLKIESKAKIDAMAAELATARSGVLASHGTVRDPRLSLYPTMFDPSHGIPTKEWALGSPSRGGCEMCHSTSAEPSSVGFFDGSKELLKNPMMQMADYDCGGDDMSFDAGGWANADHPDWMCGMFDAAQMGGNENGTCDQTEQMACRTYIATNLFPMFGMPADIGNAFPIDGVAMMQMMAIREGATAAGCNPIYSFFGFPNGTDHGQMGTNGCDANPMDGYFDYYSRDEIRLHYKKNLQQSTFSPVVAGSNWTNPVTGAAGTVPSTMNRVWGIVGVTKNPGNPAHVNKFDLGATCYNPMDGSTFPCTDGGYVLTKVNANQLLGYDTSALSELTDFNTMQASTDCAECHASVNNTNHHDGTCTSCHSAGALNGLERHDGAVPSTDNASCIECHGSKTLDLSGMAL
ncbi:MAG: hypothetical protein HZA16_11660, partial [Nitrospirae bacterium]|nr:hypothetical protein [Nitrospirota bacterium]